MSTKQTLSPLSVRDQVGERVRLGCLTGRLGAGRLETNDTRSLESMCRGTGPERLEAVLENHGISTGAVFERRS
jgi:hypothetical protein